MLLAAPRRREFTSPPGVSSSRSAESQLEFGTISDEEYFKVRLNYTQDRWKDGYDRIVAAEKQQFQSLYTEHKDAVCEYLLLKRNEYRRMMADFEQLCHADKVDAGLALDEERERRAVYELWLHEFTQMLPGEEERRARRVAEQRQVIQAQIAAARRSREAYEQQLVTSDELDMCRRAQHRGRHAVYQEWHDAVVCQLAAYHRATVALIDLKDVELWMRCHVCLEEEEVRASQLQWDTNAFKVTCIEETYERLAIAAREEAAFNESILHGALETLRYELWWLVAKDVPRRWCGEQLA